MKIKQSTFLLVIAVCSGMVFLMALPDVIDSMGTEAFTYVFTTEVLTLCLLSVVAHFYLRSVKEEGND
jgi:cbb3-type cytochrome oxidase subunit 3